ncbi:MAG: hypothetical protein GF400_04870 [Candidatus Eisenbacteria bacterium]|nr:hypothetical protein [Candidatus Eisenbacteria bacterium]
MEELVRVCERAVEMAVSGGADEAEAFGVSGDEIDVQLQKNDLHLAKRVARDALGVRVFRGMSLGFAFVNSFTDDALRSSVESALAIAAASPPDEHNGLPEPAATRPREGVLDPDASNFGVDDAVERAVELLNAAREFDPRVTVDMGELAASHGAKAIVSSRGARSAERASAFHCLIMGMAREGDTVSSFDYQAQCSRLASGIDPAAVGRRFAENVVATLGAVKGESFTGQVLLAPKAAAEIVSYPVVYAARANTVQKDMSRFAGRVGEPVASGLLTAVDDSTLVDGYATTSFDREGQPPEVLPIIEDGVLRNYLYDAYTARKDGRSSTGHAGGGPAAVPTVASTNVVWGAGATRVSDIISGIDRGVLVSRFSGNIDPVSGDFSGVVKGGRMVRAGKLAEPLCGTMIAGNTFELLSGVAAVSEERETLFSDVVPYFLLDNVVVSVG